MGILKKRGKRPRAHHGARHLVNLEVEHRLENAHTGRAATQNTVAPPQNLGLMLFKRNNFRVTVPEDAVYDRSATSHAVNLFDMASKYADVLSTDDTLRALEAIA